MVLAHKEIIEDIKTKRIVLSPCDLSKVGPNSIDVHLHPILRKVLPNTVAYDRFKKVRTMAIDLRQPPNLSEEVDLREGELVIYPGELWLGMTVEAVGSDVHVPLMHGCSTNGRSGLSPHANAGFGDIGFKTKWVLEITTESQPIVLYDGMRIAQIEFSLTSSQDFLYGRDCGTYAEQKDVVGSVPH